MSPIEVRDGLRTETIPPGQFLRLIQGNEYLSISSTESGATIRGDAFKGPKNFPEGLYIIAGIVCRVYPEKKSL